MIVSNKFIKEIIEPAVKANCIKVDEKSFAPVSQAIYNVFKYLNTLNCEISPDQTIYQQMSINDIMMPSGLAQFLEPRRIQFDVTNRLQSNLRRELSLKDEEKCNSEYTYSDFQRDITRIKVAMRCNDIEYNTSVAQAMKDVDVLTVVDKLVLGGFVNWNGAMGSEFIPVYLIEGFNLGLSIEDYNTDIDKMMNSLFNTKVKEIFTK